MGATARPASNPSGAVAGWMGVFSTLSEVFTLGRPALLPCWAAAALDARMHAWRRASCGRQTKTQPPS